MFPPEACTVCSVSVNFESTSTCRSQLDVLVKAKRCVEVWEGESGVALEKTAS